MVHFWDLEFSACLRMDSQIDEFLLHKIAFGDENAFALLYDRYARPAYSLAYRIVEDVHGAEDVVQEVFLDVWKSAGTYDIRRGQARSWLLSMVHHRSVDLIRRRRGKAVTSLYPEPEQKGAESEEVWQQVAGRIQRQVIHRALGQLPAEQQRAIEMSYFKGYTHREIAELMQEPLGTVKSRIRIGMDKLRNFLKDREARV